MKYAIEFLGKERDELLTCIKAGDSGCIERKVELEQAIAWLKTIEELGLGFVKGYSIIKLPEMKTGGFAEYRIMNDCETDDSTCWIELKDENGDPLRAMWDDVLIKRK